MGSPHISMGIALFLFFSVTHKIGLFSPNKQQHSKNSSIPIFNARDAPAHPARAGARLRLIGSGRTPLESVRAYASMPPDEAETEGRGFGRGGGQGGGRLGDFSEPAGARRRRRCRRRSQRWRVDGGVVDACGGGRRRRRVWGGGVSSFRAAK
jgi:hypothetical protein